MARSYGALSSTGTGGFKNLDKYLAKLAAIPEAMVAPLAEALDSSADELVDRMKAIAPVSELDKHPGALRESIHKEAGTVELSRKVVADARDAKGRFYAAHVEFGHGIGERNFERSHHAGHAGEAHAGDHRGHVPAKPFFFPSLALARKRLNGRIRRAMTKGVRAAVEGGER